MDGLNRSTLRQWCALLRVILRALACYGRRRAAVSWGAWVSAAWPGELFSLCWAGCQRLDVRPVIFHLVFTLCPGPSRSQ